MKKAQVILENFPLFLVTIPLFIVLHLEAEYPHLIKYEFVYSEIIQLFIAPFIILAVSLLFFRSWHKRFIYSFLLCIIFFFFADVKDYFYKISPDHFAGRYSFLLPSVFIICIAVLIVLYRSRSKFKKLLLYFNLLFLLFVIGDAVKILFANKINAKAIYLENYALADKYAPCDTCSKPDIYYLVFDYYTSSNCLATEFNYDNSKTDDFLSEKGFRIITNSRSNYNFTVHSMSSTFNMNYLKKTTPYKKIYLKDYLPVIGSVFDNELIPILQKEGYLINNLSVFDFKNAPAVIPHFNLWRYDMLYTRHNIFKKINFEIGWLINAKIPWLYKVEPAATSFTSDKDTHDSLASIALEKTIPPMNAPQQFTYLHMETAHAPFILDSTGLPHPPRPWPVPLEQDKADYISQLAYTNKVLRESLNTIFDKSVRPFVIILQGDHGFRFFRRDMKEKEFANLNAFYFPDRKYESLNDSISNINTFRIVLNKLFHQNFTMLKDSTIYVDY